MADELNQLESDLRALVVSCPTQMDVRTLLRDYKNTKGTPLPLAKYGYNNAVTFLKERCSNSFLLSGSEVNPVLTLIVPNSLKHIDKFVKKQNVSNKFSRHPEKVIKPYLGPFTYKRKSNTTQPPHTKEFNNKVTKETNRVISIPNTPAKVTINPNIVIETQCDTSKSKSYGDINVPQKNVENDETDGGLGNNIIDQLRNLNKKRSMYHKCKDDSGRQACSSGNIVKNQELEQLKCDIMKLITEAPDGVWCTDLLRLYRERYNCELNFTKFGFTSIISLVYRFEESIQITRPVETGDWLLQDAQRAAAAAATALAAAAPGPAEFHPRRLPVPFAHTNHEQLVDPDDALPGIDYDPDVFPEDCMGLKDSIPSMDLGDLMPDAMVDVMVAEVYSPSHFWFIRLGENYNIAMEDMMDEMTKYYNNEGRDRVLADGAVQVGHYCSALYERDWHRSLIVKIIDYDTVKVRHVDYGTVETVARSALRPLRRCWSRLPAQAVRARLSCVRPPAAGRRWPHASCAAFLARVTDRRFVAQVVAFDRRDAVAEVLLVDTSGEEDVYVEAELIRAGYADPQPPSAIPTLAVNLYPRFEALENGDTLNYAEIHAYLRDGIRLDCVDEYRLHVPAIAPPSPPPPPPPYDSDSWLDRDPQSSHDYSPPSPMASRSASLALPSSPSSPSSLLPKTTLSTPQSKLSKSAAVSEPTITPQTVRAPLLPTPSHLSPHVKYATHVPGGQFRSGQDLRHSYRAPVPGVPPHGSEAGFLQAQLPCDTVMSALQWEMYRVLSCVNPSAAHWFVMGAMVRMGVPPYPAMVGPNPAMHPPHPPHNNMQASHRSKSM